MIGDARRDEAHGLPIADVADRVGAGPLRQVTATERAGACPVCGGNHKPDPDRFSINVSRNVWHCRSCNEGGDPISLVQFAKACTYRSALDFLVGEGSAEIDPAEVAKRREKAAERERQRQETAARMRAKAVEDARALWARAECLDTAPVRAYLEGRGIRLDPFPPTLRYLPDRPYITKEGGALIEHHRGPCMIAAVQAPSGEVRAVHQTWIDPARPGCKAEIRHAETGAALPAKLVRGSKKGGAIRLTPKPPKGGGLIVGEGIETTASALLLGYLPGAAAWAAVDLGNMSGRMRKIEGKRHSGLPDYDDHEAFLPPPWIARLLYLQDGDSDQAATRAKCEAGIRRAMAANPDLDGRIIAAPEGQDFNDVLRERMRQDDDA